MPHYGKKRIFKFPRSALFIRYVRVLPQDVKPFFDAFNGLASAYQIISAHPLPTSKFASFSVLSVLAGPESYTRISQSHTARIPLRRIRISQNASWRLFRPYSILRIQGIYTRPACDKPGSVFCLF